jgi:hypothetical protein
MELAVVAGSNVPAVHYDLASVARGVGDFSVPAALLCNKRFDILHRNASTSPEQVMAPAPDRLFVRIPY